MSCEIASAAAGHPEGGARFCYIMQASFEICYTVLNRHCHMFRAEWYSRGRGKDVIVFYAFREAQKADFFVNDTDSLGGEERMVCWGGCQKAVEQFDL